MKAKKNIPNSRRPVRFLDSHHGTLSGIHDFRAQSVKDKQEFKQSLSYVHKHIDKLWEHVNVTNERLQTLEVEVNVLGRLLVALAVDHMKISLPKLKRLLKQIDKETCAEHQIRDLENLYRLEHRNRPSSGSHQKDSSK